MDRKIIILILISFWVISIFGKNESSQQYIFFDAKTENQLNIRELVEDLKQYDVIFFGELHDDLLIHRLQAEILPILTKDNRLAISMEMFARDIQTVVDSFLNNKITEKQFIKNSRAWSNYQRDYKPIVDFAKRKSLPVIAANVPRRYAAKLNKSGKDFIKELPPEERSYVAKDLKVLDNEYKEKFIKVMALNMTGKAEISTQMSKMFESYYAAQCLKDDTMAESINNFISKQPDYQIIHFNGQFHSNEHLGTVQKLKLLNPKLKIGVISPVIISAGEPLEFPQQEKNSGDYLLTMYRNKAGDETEKAAGHTMFRESKNSIVSHQINIKIKPEQKLLTGYDIIHTSKPISKQDTLFLLKSLTIDSISGNGKKLDYKSTVKNNFQSIIIDAAERLKTIKIEYAGKIYFPASERNYKQVHSSTLGIISADDDEGIYLPGNSWYPFMGNSLAKFEVEAVCPSEYDLITSGKEQLQVNDKLNKYRWETELDVDNLALIGNRFEIKERVVNNVILRTYMFTEDNHLADKYLDALENYLKTYSDLLGEYPFSSFSIVENFFASGFGMPNFTVLSEKVIKMPFVTLSPGVIAHEFCHNWWGNSVYVDYEKGNWCEALTVFCSNYFWNLIEGDENKAFKWRKDALMDINLLEPEKQYPLKEFVYQEDSDDAVIGYSKGAYFFITLYNLFGEKDFFQRIREFYYAKRGEYADWQDIEKFFSKELPSKLEANVDIGKIFKFWLYEKEIPVLKIEKADLNNNQIQLTLKQNPELTLKIPYRIYYENNYQDGYFYTNKSNNYTIETEKKVKMFEIDPEAKVLKKIPENSMPYNLKRTLKNKPLLLIPDNSQFKQRLKMVGMMLQRSGYDITIASANAYRDYDWENRNIFVLGSWENNEFLQMISKEINEEITIELNRIKIDDTEVNSPSASALFTTFNPRDKKKLISFYIWNSAQAVKSFRTIFHYMNESWYLFDLEKMPKKPLKQGLFLPKNSYDLKVKF